MGGGGSPVLKDVPSLSSSTSSTSTPAAPTPALVPPTPSSPVVASPEEEEESISSSQKRAITLLVSEKSGLLSRIEQLENALEGSEEVAGELEELRTTRESEGKELIELREGHGTLLSGRKEVEARAEKAVRFYAA